MTPGPGQILAPVGLWCHDSSCDKVLIKVDMKNAFNTIRHDKMHQIAIRCPEVLHMVRLAYVTPTPLYFGRELAMSMTEVQQGDPLRSLVFAQSYRHSVPNSMSGIWMMVSLLVLLTEW